MNEIPKPASPLPKLEVCDLGDDRINIIAAGSHERVGASVNKAKWIMEMVDPEDAEEDAETMMEWARHIVWAANNALALYEALEKARQALAHHGVAHVRRQWGGLDHLEWHKALAIWEESADPARDAIDAALKAARGEK